MLNSYGPFIRVVSMRSTEYSYSNLPPIHKQIFAGVATSWRVLRSNLCRSKRFSLIQNRSYGLRSPPSLLSSGFSGSLSLVKAAGPEFGHPYTSNIEFKKGPIHTTASPPPPGRKFMVWTGGGRQIYLLPLSPTGVVSQKKCLQITGRTANST